jgi:hypothetical protein
MYNNIIVWKRGNIYMYVGRWHSTSLRRTTGEISLDAGETELTTADA